MNTRADIANESNRKLYQNHLASMAKLREARLRIEELEAQVDRLRAAIYDMSAYISRDNSCYMEPQTREVLREINGGSK